MAENITGSVVGKVKFQIDQPSWKALEKFQAKLTSVKRQMSTMHKTIKVQAVVKQMTDVTKKVTNNSIAEKKREMNAHVSAKQKHDQQVGKLYDRALTEDRRRDAARIRQAERTNAQMLRADLRLDAQRQRMLSKEAGASNRFGSRAAMYTQVKEQQARIAGVNEAGLAKIRATSVSAMNTSGGDIALFRHQLQQTTKDLIHNTREMNNNRVTLRSLRTDLVQMTAAYTAFSGVVNIAQTGMTMEGLRAGAKVFAKDEAGVADHMKFIADEADRLGVNLLTATKEFTKFSIATKNKISAESGRSIFSGVSEYAAILQVDDQQFERAFKSINQMLSKGQLMKEEISGQLGEALYGSIPVLAQAYGFEGTQAGEEAFFKAVESGSLKATEDKFLAFAKGLSDIAKSNGALEAVTKKTRAEMNRFFNTLTLGKDTIFQSGMGEGLSYMFGEFSDVLKDNQETFKAFGAAFKGVTFVLTSAIKLVLAPIELLIKGFQTLLGSGGITAVAGGVTVLAIAVKSMAASWALANLSMMTFLRNAAKFGVITTAALAVEDYTVASSGGKSIMQAKSYEDIINYSVNPFTHLAKQGVEVIINWKDEAAKQMIGVEVNKANQRQLTSLDDSNGG